MTVIPFVLIDQSHKMTIYSDKEKGNYLLQYHPLSYNKHQLLIILHVSIFLLRNICKGKIRGRISRKLDKKNLYRCKSKNLKINKQNLIHTAKQRNICYSINKLLHKTDHSC